MLVFTGVLSAPALAIPSVGKEHAKAFEGFAEHVRVFAHTYVQARPDALLLVSPHGERYAEAASIALHDPYKTSLRDIGDYSEPLLFSPFLAGMNSLQESWQKKPLQATTSTQEYLDHTSSSCLTLLHLQEAPTIPLLVATPPAATPKLLFSYGSALRDWSIHRPERIAIIFTTFLSNRLSELSPGGVHPIASSFNQLLQQSLVDGNTVPLLRYEDEIAKALGGSDALDLFRMAAGVLSEARTTPHWHGEDELFGIGHTAMSFTPV